MIYERICNKCFELKNIDNFNKLYNDYQKICKSCRKIYRQNNKDKIKLKNKIYHLNNSDIIKLKRQIYRDKNRLKLAAKQREYVAKNKEEVKIKKSEWKKNNRDKINLKNKEYMKDPVQRLRHNLRSRMRQALKKDYKSGCAIKFLGCSIQFFKEYIESIWLDGMSWENYGSWHLDHIIPICTIKQNDLEQINIVCFYKNIRPLWAFDNLSKGSKIIS